MGVSAHEKRDHSEGKQALLFTAHFFVLLFLQEGSRYKEPSSALWVQRVSVSFSWGPVPEHQLGAGGLVGAKTVSVRFASLQEQTAAHL